jgi:hypothetical protein
MPVKLNMKMLPLALVGLGTMVIVALALAFLLRAWWTNPISVLGIADAPHQPIAFPHTVHVTDAGIQCEFCHRNVSQGDAATVPAVEQCLFCHETIVGVDNPEIAKLLEHGGLNSTGQEDASMEPHPIKWARVHRLPDTVQFAHEPHIRFFSMKQGMETAQVCSICHGNVAQMEQVEQVRSLKMGDCVDCHSKNDAPTDCTTCHY